MTCIVGVVDKIGNVWIGGDSAGVDTSAGSNYSMGLHADKKVFTRVDDSGIVWAFGFTTSFRMGQLIHYDLKLPKLEKEDRLDLHKFLVTKFTVSLRECFAGGGFREEKQGRESGGTFLLGLLGELFIVEDDYQIAKPIHCFAAVGSGAQIALGALGATSNMKNTERRIKKALTWAETFNAGVRRPFHIVVARKKIEGEKMGMT